MKRPHVGKNHRDPSELVRFIVPSIYYLVGFRRNAGLSATLGTKALFNDVIIVQEGMIKAKTSADKSF
jgi:hypothetical protein